MSRLQRYYDSHARNCSLNWAIAITLIFSAYSFLGFLQFLKYFQHHDTFYLLVGPFNILLGIAGIFQGVYIIHAVVRRLIAQSVVPPRPVNTEP